MKAMLIRRYHLKIQGGLLGGMNLHLGGELKL